MNRLLCTVLIFICGSIEAGENSVQPRTVDQIRDGGVLRLLVYPSLEDEFLRIDISKSAVVPVSPADHYLGIDVDIVKGFASSLGVELEIRPAYAPGTDLPSFDQLIPSLLRGEGDLVASAFSITEERQKLVDFSNPYYIADLVVVVPDRSRISSQEDLHQARGAVMPGSSQEEMLKNLGVREVIRLELLSTECFEVLSRDDADFCLLGMSSTEHVDQPGFKEAFRFEAVDRYAIAVPHESPILPMINKYIESLRASGDLQSIIDTHLK